MRRREHKGFAAHCCSKSAYGAWGCRRRHCSGTAPRPVRPGKLPQGADMRGKTASLIWFENGVCDAVLGQGVEVWCTSSSGERSNVRLSSDHQETTDKETGEDPNILVRERRPTVRSGGMVTRLDSIADCSSISRTEILVCRTLTKEETTLATSLCERCQARE
jgi:hypothetical protein